MKLVQIFLVSSWCYLITQSTTASIQHINELNRNRKKHLHAKQTTTAAVTDRHNRHISDNPVDSIGIEGKTETTNAIISKLHQLLSSENPKNLGTNQTISLKDKNTNSNTFRSMTSELGNAFLDNCNFLDTRSHWEPSASHSNCISKRESLSVDEIALQSHKFVCILYRSAALHSHASDTLEITLSDTGYRMSYIASEGNLLSTKIQNQIRFEISHGSYLRLALYEYYSEHGLPKVLSIILNGQKICKIIHQIDLIKDWIKNTDHHQSVPTTEHTDAINQPHNIPITITSKSAVQCGVKQMKQRGFLLNGESTQPGDWPWHAAIYLRNKNLKYICGGTLISDRVILTAAHCVYENDDSLLIPERISIYLGHYHINRFPSHSKEYGVFSIIPHESYNFTNMHNDIAILKLSTVVTYTSYIYPSCLATDNFDIMKKVGRVIGWGIEETGELSPVLRSGYMPVVPPIECLESNRDFFGMFLFETNYCAGFRNNSNVCPGDSGGGMFFQYGEQQWHLHGIVSLGMRNEDGISCETKEYVLFTDVAKYDKWIKGHV